MAFERLEGPLGIVRADVHAAMVCSSVINANRTRRRPYRMSDFMPRWDTHREPHTPEQMLAAAVGLNRSMGGADHRKG